MAKNRKEQKKEYYLKNKDKFKEYRLINKDKFKEYKQSEKGKKSNTISKWKLRGLIHDNYDELYDRYINSKKCELCNKEYTKKNKRCLDHSHITFLVCNNCNCSSKLKEINKNNTSGHKNIIITKYNTYMVRINVNKISYNKTFIFIEEAIEYRDFLL